MKIKPWNFYAVREPRGHSRHRMALIVKWRDEKKTVKAVKTVKAGWEGWLMHDDFRAMVGPIRWYLHGNILERGQPCINDLTEHLISARDLVFRKLNPPPIEWFLAAYQRRLLEDFMA